MSVKPDLPRMRLKTRFHSRSGEKTPKQLASVAAFIFWRLAEAAVTHMQHSDFTVAGRTQGIPMLSEYLVFMIQIADRLAFRRLDEEARRAFITELVLRLAGILEENQVEHLGGDSQTGYQQQFIELFNRRAPDYATFDFDPQEGPGFPFKRYLAMTLCDLADPSDRSWIYDQVMEIEVPQALLTVNKALDDLYGPAPV